MKMKCAALLALTLALCLLVSGACVAEWATVRGQSDRVHLRAGSSKNASSMGLYFNGCPVWVEGEARNGYSAVIIGTESGYMMTKYLTTAAVTPKTPLGTVWSSNGRSVNMRSEPSKSSALVCTLASGTDVTVYGETKSGWYYVDTGRESGYISSNLIEVSRIMSDLSTSVGNSGSSPSGSIPSYGGTASSGGARLVQTLELDEGGKDVRIEVTQISENPGYGEATYSVRVEANGRTAQTFTCTGGRANETLNAVYQTDVNMDGYPDLMLMGIAGASDAFGTHYLYDPASGRFIEHPELADFSAYRCTLYPRTGYVLNYLHDGAATGTWALYQWQNGRLVTLARASMLTPEYEVHSDRLQAKVERLVSGRWQTVYEDTFVSDDRTWQEQYDAVLAALWNGIEPGSGQGLAVGL